MTTRVGAGMVAGQARKLLGDEGDARLAAARRILETLGELKGAALKVGQTMALISDQLPPEARAIVARLFSQAPTLPYEQIAAAVEAELGKPPEALFSEFSKEPFAGASLGQVHRARLTSGEVVAVKVQYPGVEAALEDDMRNVQVVLKAVGIGGRLLDGREYFEEMRREITLELDYVRELRLLEEFRGYLGRWPDLVVPRAWPQLCSRRVLTLELLEGPTLHEYVKGIDQVGNAERLAVSEQLSRAVLGPFVYHRVIHGDAHPGNFVIMSGGRLGVLDYGSAKHLSEQFWRAYVGGFLAGIENRRLHFPTMLRDAGFSFDLPEAKAAEVFDAVAEIVGEPFWGPYDWSQDTMIPKLIGLKKRYALDFLHVRVPPEALLFYRAIAGLGHNLRSLKSNGDFRQFLREGLAEVGARAGQEAPAGQPPA
ncbi:MAG TPA: AarF/ABC1/UbiB kinase family protein [Myxococcales bacterium]|jgi:predicted unusual protein kinase regulating ubiquinone biosynthesis (AarF/ABC1/UbiB family)